MLNLITNFKLRNASSTKSIMKKIFLITVLLSFAFIANSCSDDDDANCGCNGNLDQTITEAEGNIRVFEYDNGDFDYTIRSYESIPNVASKIFYICNKDFVDNNISVEGDDILILFSGKYTSPCPASGFQPQDATPRYSMKLTQIELQ